MKLNAFGNKKEKEEEELEKKAMKAEDDYARTVYHIEQSLDENPFRSLSLFPLVGYCVHGEGRNTSAILRFTEYLNGKGLKVLRDSFSGNIPINELIMVARSCGVSDLYYRNSVEGRILFMSGRQIPKIYDLTSDEAVELAKRYEPYISGLSPHEKYSYFPKEFIDKFGK